MTADIGILDYKLLDINKITFSQPQKIKGGSFLSMASYEETPIYIQSPRLHNINGITKLQSICNLELEFDKTHMLFFDFMSNIDDNNIVQIHKYSKKWFNKEFPLDIVEEFYKSPIKVSRNKPPKLKLKLLELQFALEKFPGESIKIKPPIITPKKLERK